MRKTTAALGLLVALFAIVWVASAPATYHEIAGPRLVGEVPSEIARADKGDVVASSGTTIAPEVLGHDEILQVPGTSDILVSGRDERIWRVNAETQEAEPIAETPLSPTGARMVPGTDDEVYYCMARLDYNQYDATPGLYKLNLTNGEFTEVVTRVPITGQYREDGLELPNGADTDTPVVYPTPFKMTAVSSLDDGNSRLFQFCNDLDVSADGRHVYMTEPVHHPKASSGLGVAPEAITLAPNGRVWRYDPQTHSIGLVVENIIFADGILLEYDEEQNESGLLITETLNFRIGRAHLSGERAGQYDVLWDDLPGYPDGMDRDAQGRIWIGVIKDRTPLMTWMHRNPWVKPLLLRIPARLLPTAKGTAILGLSADAEQVVAYTHHDGSKVRDVSVVVPIGDRLYLPSFFPDNRGVHSIGIADVLNGS